MNIHLFRPSDLRGPSLAPASDRLTLRRLFVFVGVLTLSPCTVVSLPDKKTDELLIFLDRESAKPDHLAAEAEHYNLAIAAATPLVANLEERLKHATRLPDSPAKTLRVSGLALRLFHAEAQLLAHRLRLGQVQSLLLFHKSTGINKKGRASTYLDAAGAQRGAFSDGLERLADRIEPLVTDKHLRLQFLATLTHLREDLAKDAEWPSAAYR